MTIAPLRLAVALPVFSALVVAGLSFYDNDARNRDLALSLAFGAAFGLVLQRGRFCFLCNFRDLLQARLADGVLAILVALAVGALGYALVMGAWMPVISGERLPPSAHIGPISLALPVAAFVFGTGMAISGSCLSGHLYRLGEGSPTAPFAILGTALGFLAGFLSWNTVYVTFVAGAPVAWLPHRLGYAGTLGATLAVLALLAVLVLKVARPSPSLSPVAPNATEGDALAGALERVFVRRWPPAVTGALVGLLATLAYFRVAPLGVTAELGSLTRTAAGTFQLLPDTLHGLDGFRGCATAVKTAIFSPNGLFVIGLVAASFASAVLAGQFTPAWPTLRQVRDGLIGGVLVGWGAMIALGCTVGVLLSGIHAGALSGWIFLIACAAGVAAGLKLKSLWNPA